ncbi:glycosyltransferase family 4 protein [Enterococcus casseliflavus]|uniref:glycosyltransferase family 4 protein n=1 Tax=Enterococcus casseliflavus TaxID=37734 RepID=UPI003D12C3D6
MKKLNILICTTCSLPIPATKGGAVESLIEGLILENEKEKFFSITVITLEDNLTRMDSNRYNNKNTNFIFLKKHKLISAIDILLTKIFRIIKRDKSLNSKNLLWKFLVKMNTIKILLNSEYDKVIFENSPHLLKVLNNKNIFCKYKGKIVFHLHNEINYNKKNLNLLNKCTQIFTVSNFLEKRLKIEYPQLETQILVLRNGIDDSFYNLQLTDSKKKEMRSELGFSTEDKIILFVGRITPEKGIFELVQSLNYLTDKKIKILIVGNSFFGSNTTTPFEEKLKKELLNVENRVIFTGYIQKKNLWKFYSISDIAVLPSIWQEPLGLTIMEAVICGIPLITTESGGIVESVDNKFSIVLPINYDLPLNIANSVINILNNNNAWIRKAQLQKEIFYEKNNNEKFFASFSDFIKE